MNEKASNEAQERLRAWRENCLSCQHYRHLGAEPRCAAGDNGWVYVHTVAPVLTLSDVTRASWWATRGECLNVPWISVAASCQPFCPKYERATQ